MRRSARHRAGLTARLAVGVAVALAVVAGAIGPANAPAASADDAAPLWEYRSRVEGAYESAEAASTHELTDLAASELAADIATLLPATEQVDLGDGRVLTVDNSILRSLVSRLDSLETPDERRDVLNEMRRHLASLRQAVSGDPAQVPADRARLERLLSAERAPTRSPFAELFGDIVEWLVEWLSAWWEGVGTSPTASTALTWITVGIVVALLSVLAFVLGRAAVRAMRARARRDVVLAPVVPSRLPHAAEEPSADPLAAADALASEGRLTAAVRVLLSGAARRLARAGLLRQTRTHTNGELLRQVREDAAVHEPLTGLAAVFDRAYYGHREPDREAYDAARIAYRTLVRVIEQRASGPEPRGGTKGAATEPRDDAA